MSSVLAVETFRNAHGDIEDRLRWSGSIAVHLARRYPTAVVGLAVLLTLCGVAVLAPVLSPYDPADFNPAIRLQSPTQSHWFGTDTLGQDVFSRVLYGTRVSLIVGFSVAMLASVAGSAIGLCAAYLRHTDLLLMRIMDGVMAVPGLLLALALAAIVGQSLWPVILILAVVQVPDCARLVRSCVLTVRETLYIEAARCIGVDDARIMWRHVFPNTLAPVLVQSTYYFAWAVLAESALSFLGTGVPVTTPSWGNIIGQGQTVIQQAPWLSIFPGTAIAVTALAISVIGDGLRDLLDPVLTRGA